MGLFRPLVKKGIGVGVRAGLVALGTWLINNGYAETGQIENLVLESTPIIAALALSAWEKISSLAANEISKDKAEVPRAVSHAEVKTAIAQTPMTEKFSLALQAK